MDARSRLFSDDRLNLEPVGVPAPEWGLPLVYVLQMDGFQRSKFEDDWAEFHAADEDASFKAYALAWMLCDENGEPMAKPEEVAVLYRKLCKKNSKALARAFLVASHVNGLTKSDLDRLEGKCEAETPAGGSAGSGGSL